MNNPLINIITRTSNRPNYFNFCYNSVRSQTYKNINHIISVDNEETEKYVKTYTNNYVVVNPISENQIEDLGNIKKAPYELYLNHLKDHIKDGWIMFLDDDDKFISNGSVQKIVNHIKNDDQLMLWKVQFPNRTIPEDHYFNNKKIELNHISMIGFMYHKKYDNIKFKPYYGGDYFFIKELEKIIPNKIWINDIFTGLQRKDSMGGFGKKDDVKL